MPIKASPRGPKALLNCRGVSCGSLVLASIATVVIVSFTSHLPLPDALVSRWPFAPGCAAPTLRPPRRSAAGPPTAGALSLSDLPPRIDAACEDGAPSQADLYLCREAAVKKLAREACQRLKDDPPNPPFDRVKLELNHLKSLGHVGTGVHIPKSIDMAVEVEDDIVSEGLRRDGTWEESELHTVLTGLERAAPLRLDGGDPVLLDIGANLGTYTFMAAAFGYPVRAFEAMPRNVAAIHQTLCWNPAIAERVTLFPFALAEEEARCAVLATTFNVANGLLVCSDEQLKLHLDFEIAGQTHAVRLGDYLGAVRSDVMKMDVEGFEPMVLRSAGSALEHVQMAATEINSDQLPKQNGMSYDEIIEQYLQRWRELGFEMHICQGPDEDTWIPCMDKPLASKDDVAERGRTDLIDVAMQRP
eukprot:jgi/Ulvmu1/1219/UM109_0017.1